MSKTVSWRQLGSVHAGCCQIAHASEDFTSVLVPQYADVVYASAISTVLLTLHVSMQMAGR